MDDNRENHHYPKLSESQKHDFERFINEELTTLSQRECKVIKMRLGLIGQESMSPKEIANHLNIDIDREYKIELNIYKAIDKLSKIKKHPVCEISNDRIIVYTSGLEYELTDDGNGYRVVEIGEDFSFSSENVNIPPFYNGKPVTHIGEYMIPNMSCCFKHIYLPETILEISEKAFCGTCFVETLSVAKENSVYHSTNNCLIKTKSKELVFGCHNSIIPFDGSVVCISQNAFVNCGSLYSIIIPKEISCISSGAFYDCENLSVVYYCGTKSEWDIIKIASYNQCLNDATVLFYSENRPIIKGNYWRFVDNQPLPWN